MTTDPAVLANANVTVDALIAEMRDGYHRGAPLREQIPLIERLAEQYDLAGMHDVARGFRRKADALIPLRDMQDRRHEEIAQRQRGRRKWLRVLSLGAVRD